MTSTLNAKLKNLNSFAVNATTAALHTLHSVDELAELVDNLTLPFYILGEGSNTLFTEEKAPVIIQPAFKGITFEENEQDYLISVAAGENWHDLVCLLVGEGIGGLENLALIPGSVGAAPVQNIGAYGVEFSDLCLDVSWYSFSDKSLTVFNHQQCDFGYRSSVFKNKLKGSGLITNVRLKIPKNIKAKLKYAGLDALPTDASPAAIMEKVIEIRNTKLPDPKMLANAGSFFKNPVITLSMFTELNKKFPAIPAYPQPNGDVKVAAGWLIEEAGLKGYRIGNVGVHEKQALVLVNHGNATGKEIMKLALFIQEAVFTMCDIKLEPEVRMIGQSGEVFL